MQDRGETTQERGRYDRVGIIELARERMNEGTAQGLPEEPWLDPERDFFRETYEELADALNYTQWNMKRNAGLRFIYLRTARYLIKVTYEITLYAERASGNDIKAA